MELYARPKQDALKTLNSTEGGLTQEEAERRLAAFGKNELKEGKRRSIPALFFAQFKDLMTLILVAAAVLSGVLAYSSSCSTRRWGWCSSTAPTAPSKS